VSTGSAITGFPPGTLTGTENSNNAVAIQAKADLITAYNNALNRTTTEDLTGQDLGGLTLTPGVYEFSSSAQLTGTLTLNGLDEPDPVFIFKIGSTLTTASSSNFNLIRGARYCRTFWQVGSSATLGTGSNFVGHIFAMESITANTGARVQGQLLARTSAVTLDTNTIINGFCTALQVTKEVSVWPVGNHPNFEIKISGPSYPGGNSKTFNAASGMIQTWIDLIPGDYIITEGNLDTGWTALPPEHITVSDGVTTTATVTNTYTPPSYNDRSGGGGTVVVTPPVTVTRTVTGGQLPKTSTPLYELLLIGAVLTLVGAVGWRSRKRYE